MVARNTVAKLFTHLTEASRLAVLAAPISLGQPLGGVELGPSKIASTGVFDRLLRRDWNVAEMGAVGCAVHSAAPLEAVHIAPSCVDEHVRALSFHNASLLGPALEAVAAAARAHGWLRDFVLTLGGDHSTAVGSIAGVCDAWNDLGVVWVDAHADFNTPASSPSGNFHGMPLAALCGVFPLHEVAGFEWFRAPLSAKDVVIVGARALDVEEAALLAVHGVRVFSADEVFCRGMDAVMDDALAHLLARGPRPLHLSFDIDALDAALVPGTGTPEPAGLALDEAETLCRRLRDTGMLVGMDLVEVNPLREKPEALEDSVGERTLGCAAALLLAALDRGPS